MDLAEKILNILLKIVKSIITLGFNEYPQILPSPSFLSAHKNRSRKVCIFGYSHSNITFPFFSEIKEWFMINNAHFVG